MIKKTFFNFVYTVYFEDSNKYLMVNIDQTGATLILGESDNIYEVQSAKQVFIYGKEEKREFTIVLSVHLEGKILPKQSF